MHNRVAQRISNVETRMELSFRRCFSHDREISSAGQKRKTLYKIRVSSKRATPCFPLCILEERKHSKRGKKATSYATRKIKVWLSVEGGTCLGCFNTLVSDGANIQLYASHSAWKYARARLQMFLRKNVYLHPRAYLTCKTFPSVLPADLHIAREIFVQIPLTLSTPPTS